MAIDELAEPQSRHEGSPSRRQPVLRSLTATNVLSFGSSADALQFTPLTVLIGPNGSGKSNLLALIRLLRSLPRDLQTALREQGGLEEWKWKGNPRATAGSLLALFASKEPGDPDLRYEIALTDLLPVRPIRRERLGDEGVFDRWFEASYAGTRIDLRGEQRDASEGYNHADSMLAQRRDPFLYPNLTHTARLFESFRMYDRWRFDRTSPARRPQPADLPNAHLEEDASNLGLILNKLQQNSRIKRRFIALLQTFYSDAEDIGVQVEGGTVQIFLHEKAFATPIPAPRLSDGTLQWITLLAVLLHPSPPPLVCIEEPEAGLHPDMMPILAGLLREASERMQLIVTTHSDSLVDALSDTPESVVVCEKVDGATTMQRLSPEKLALWLEKYTLGQLWRSGEIGGNRW